MNRRSFIKSAAALAAVPTAASAAMGVRRETCFDVDICVAGGGPGGLAAAITAARCGAKVLLLEAGTCFGGCGTQAGVSSFCSVTDGEHLLSGGFGAEVCGRIVDAGAAIAGITRENMFKRVFIYRVEPVKRVYDEMVLASGCSFLFGVRVVEAHADASGHVTDVTVAGKRGLFTVRAKVFVDATGDADLCAFAGAVCEFGDAEGLVQGATLPSFWAQVDWKRAEAAGYGLWRQDKHLKEAYEKGVFSTFDPHMTGLYPSGETTASGNIGHVWLDPRDDRSLSRAYVEARKGLKEYEDYYRRYVPGCEKAEILSTGSLMGVRESRRIVGDSRLTADDYYARRHFPDEIGCGAYQIDLHATKPGEEAAKKVSSVFRSSGYKRGENYGIPYGTLLPKTLANVLVVGRAISTDRAVQGSVRVMPACYLTGQAAGFAADMAARRLSGDVRAVRIGELRDRIRKAGVYLPG